MKRALPVEPPAGDGVVTVVVRLHDGSRLSPRRFKDTDKISDLYSFVSIAMAEKSGTSTIEQPFHLVSNMPMRTFSEKSLTLAQADLLGQTLLIVQPI